jgi:hypothetical protein
VPQRFFVNTDVALIKPRYAHSYKIYLFVPQHGGVNESKVTEFLNAHARDDRQISRETRYLRYPVEKFKKDLEKIRQLSAQGRMDPIWYAAHFHPRHEL